MPSEKLLYFSNLLVSRLINAGKSASSISPSEILCVKLDEIGDMATALVVFPWLKKQFPSAKITVLCKPFAGSLLDNNPNIYRVIHNINEWEIRYDMVIELRGTWQTLWKSIHPKFWPIFRLDRGWIRFIQRGKQMHESITNFRIVEPLLDLEKLGMNLPNSRSKSRFLPIDSNLMLRSHDLLFPSSEDKKASEIWISQAKDEALERTGEQPLGVAVIHAGARKRLRQWPLTNFAEVARWLWVEQRIWPIWVCTKEEKEDLEGVFTPELGTLWVSEEAQPNNTSLLAFFALIQGSRIFIGNESGPLQLADLAGVPLLGLFGPGVPDVFYPTNAQVIHVGNEPSISNENKENLCTEETENISPKVVVHCLLNCNPCDQINCLHSNNPCIQRISVGTVIDVLKSRLLTQ